MTGPVPNNMKTGAPDQMAAVGWDKSVTWTDRQAAIQNALAIVPMDADTTARLTAELADLTKGVAVIWPGGRPGGKTT